MPILTFQQAQCNAEKLGDGDGDKAVSVSSDKSHETKGTVSETKEQDRPVDTVMLPCVQMFGFASFMSNLID